MADDMITGTLHADLLADGRVQIIFAPNTGAGPTHPRVAENINKAEADFFMFGFTRAKAVAFRQEVERNRTATAVITIDMALVASLSEGQAIYELLLKFIEKHGSGISVRDLGGQTKRLESGRPDFFDLLEKADRFLFEDHWYTREEFMHLVGGDS